MAQHDANRWAGRRTPKSTLRRDKETDTNRERAQERARERERESKRARGGGGGRERGRQEQRKTCSNGHARLFLSSFPMISVHTTFQPPFCSHKNFGPPGHSRQCHGSGNCFTDSISKHLACQPRPQWSQRMSRPPSSHNSHSHPPLCTVLARGAFGVLAYHKHLHSCKRTNTRMEQINFNMIAQMDLCASLGECF